MTNDLISCIGNGSYSEQPITTRRGIKDEEYIYDDEERLRSFLSLSEDAKQECEWTYETKDNALHKEMKILWNAKSLSRR